MGLWDSIRQIIRRDGPTLSESTGRQGLSLFGVNGIAGLPGFGTYVTPIGSYWTYRRMRTDPTIALARVVACAPVKAAQHSFESDDGVPEERVTIVQHAIDRHWERMVSELLWALDYGWKSCEIVWDYGKSGALEPVKIKPLAVDFTDPTVDEHGNYTGVRNSGVDLGWGKSLYYGYDVEDQNYYGRSRNENIRAVWGRAEEVFDKQRQYFMKVAGVIPVVRYPDMQVQDANGNMISAFEGVKKIIRDLGNGGGVAFPTVMAPWVEDALRAGAKPADISAWAIEFLETTADHGGSFENALRYFDSLKMRGWLVPERTATEGQMGTKAEAAAHGDVAVQIAEEIYRQIVAAINDQVVDPMLAYNWGPRAKGSVRAVATPLGEDDRSLGREIIKTILTNPVNMDMVLESLDWDAMIDREGLPKAKQVIEPGLPGVDTSKWVMRPVGQPSPSSVMASLYRGLNRAVLNGVR